MATGSKFYNGLALPRYGETAITGETAANDVFTATGPDGTQTGNLIVAKVTSTAAVTAGDQNKNGIVVDLNTTGVLNAAFAVDMISATGTIEYLLAVHGSKAPSYLLGVGSTTVGVGAAADIGFFDAAARFISAPSTAITYGVLKMLAGSKVYHIVCVPDTGMPVT